MSGNAWTCLAAGVRPFVLDGPKGKQLGLRELKAGETVVGQPGDDLDSLFTSLELDQRRAVRFILNGPGDQPASLVHRTDRDLNEVERDDLARAWRPLVLSIAKTYEHNLSTCGDPESAAVAALGKASATYDPRRGVKFLTYLYPLLHGELMRDRRDSTNQKRPMSRRRYEFLVALEREERKRQDGQQPPLSEGERAKMATRYGLRDSRPRQPHEELAYNLDRPARKSEGDTQEVTMQELLRCPRAAADLAEVEHLDTWAALGRVLPERLALILTWTVRDELSQTEIGKRLGLSQMHVSRLLKEAKVQAAQHLPERVL
jgi:RNA polymerase sigma-B factor